MPQVNHDILRWARETAGLTLDEAAKKIALNAARGKSGAERLAALEAGEEEPSRQQLARMATHYRRPLTTFYLAARPAMGERGEDFRRAPGAPPADFNPRLDALIRNIRARQDVVRFLLEEEESEPLAFVASAELADGVDAVASSIIKTTSFDLAEFRRRADINKAFSYLRDRLERVGIFVLVLGDLGSHHSKIDPRAFRGYAIADPIAPFIVINDNDAHAAWSFTALHEAAHLWLGQTGISGASHEAKVERFCNDVAGTILLPRAEIDAIKADQLGSLDDSIATINAFASERNVSRAMVAYLLLRAEKIDTSRYTEIDNHLYNAWLKSKEKKVDKEDGGGAPSRYVVLRHRLGPALTGLARQHVQAGTLSPMKASSLLGVKPGSVRVFLFPEGA